MQAPFRENNLTNDQIEWKCSPCICGMDIRRYNKLLKIDAFKKILKIGLSAVGKMYLVCGLLHNARTSLYKQQHQSILTLIPHH